MSNSDEDVAIALESLQEMGFSGGLAVDALMRAGGDVLAAANLLAGEHDNSTRSKGRGAKGKGKGKGKGQGKGKGKVIDSHSNHNGGVAAATSVEHLQSVNQLPSECSGHDFQNTPPYKQGNTQRRKGRKSSSQARAARYADMASTNASQAGEASAALSFREKRQIAIAARKQARNSRQVCKVCGGPHPRRECPGIMDGGKGQSRHRGASKQMNQARRKNDANELSVSERRLRVGEWTGNVSYLDACSDLVALHHELNVCARTGGRLGVAELIDALASGEVQELKEQHWLGFTGGLLQIPVIGSEVGAIIAALCNSRSSQSCQHQFWGVASARPCDLDVIYTAVQSIGSSATAALAYQRNLVEDAGQTNVSEPVQVAAVVGDALEQLIMSQWGSKYQHQTTSGSASDIQSSSRDGPGELSTLHPEGSRVCGANEEMKSMPGSGSEPELHVKLEPEPEYSCESQIELEGRASRARTVKKHDIVAISCGLDYGTSAAMALGERGTMCRKVQRAVCREAMLIAARYKVPLFIECKMASRMSTVDTSGKESASDEDVVADLIKLLVSHVPSDCPILLRQGTLTTHKKLHKLLRAYPNMLVGLSASVGYSKASPALLSVAYDIQLERLALTSEAPEFLPADFGGGKGFTCCLPAHCATTAMTIASVRDAGTPGGTAATVAAHGFLQASTANICKAFQLPCLDSNEQGGFNAG